MPIRIGFVVREPRSEAPTHDEGAKAAELELGLPPGLVEACVQAVGQPLLVQVNRCLTRDVARMCRKPDEKVGEISTGDRHGGALPVKQDQPPLLPALDAKVRRTPVAMDQGVG